MVSAIFRMRLRQVFGRARDEGGFTMVEMIIAIFIFGIVIVGLAVGMSTSLNLTRQNRNRSIAANLASQQMDSVRSTAFDELANQTQVTQPTTSSTSVEGVSYTLSQTTAWITRNETGAQNATGPCQNPPTSTNPLAYIAVTSSVSWPDMRGIPPVVSSTVVTPPVGLYDSTEGHIAVTVLNAAGQPLSGVTVTITSTGVTDTAVTSPVYGCAFFAFEPVGTYTITLPANPGMVDGQGNPSPTQTTTVKAAKTSSVQFLYDSASSLVLTLTPKTAGYTIPATVPVSLGNTHLLPSGVLSYTTPTGSPRTVSNLFPYSDGYQPWAGSCSDADPEGKNPSSGAAYYAGATRATSGITTVSMTPGAGSAGVITVPSVQLKFVRTSTSATYTITATHSAAYWGLSSDTGCPTAEAYTLSSSLSVGTTAVSLPASLPFGAWTIGWRNNSSGTTGSSTVLLSPLNANNPYVPSTVTVS